MPYGQNATSQSIYTEPMTQGYLPQSQTAYPQNQVQWVQNQPQWSQYNPSAYYYAEDSYGNQSASHQNYPESYGYVSGGLKNGYHGKANNVQGYSYGYGAF